MEEDEAVNVNLVAFEKQTSRLWRAWRTAHELVRDRGYDLSEDEIRISLEQFKATHCSPNGSVNYSTMTFSARPSSAMEEKHRLLPTALNPNPESDIGPIWVEFNPESGSIGVNTVKKFIHHCCENNFRAGILVTGATLSSQARAAINKVKAVAHVEYFMEDDLLVNITHHELVPRHVLLSPAEKQALLKRYRLKETQLPRIMNKDPVARYMGLKRGQVVKIIRNSETAGRYASYRLCV